MARRRKANRRDRRTDVGPCRVCKGPPFSCWQDEINHLLWGRRQVFTLSLPGHNRKCVLVQIRGHDENKTGTAGTEGGGCLVTVTSLFYNQ